MVRRWRTSSALRGAAALTNIRPEMTRICHLNQPLNMTLPSLMWIFWYFHFCNGAQWKKMKLSKICKVKGFVVWALDGASNLETNRRTCCWRLAALKEIAIKPQSTTHFILTKYLQYYPLSWDVWLFSGKIHSWNHHCNNSGKKAVIHFICLLDLYPAFPLVTCSAQSS